MNLYRDSKESPSVSSVILNEFKSRKRTKNDSEEKKKERNGRTKVVRIHKITCIGTKKKRDIEVVLIIHEYYYFNSGFLVTLTE